MAKSTRTTATTARDVLPGPDVFDRLRQRVQGFRLVGQLDVELGLNLEIGRSREVVVLRGEHGGIARGLDGRVRSS